MKIYCIGEEMFPVTSKTNENSKPVAIPIEGSICDFEIPPNICIIQDELRRLREPDHNQPNRIKLHNEFQFIYGYLDINGGASPQSDYHLDEPMHSKYVQLLERFVSFICNFVFKRASAIGSFNANATAKVLGKNVCNMLNEQVIFQCQ